MYGISKCVSLRGQKGCWMPALCHSSFITLRQGLFPSLELCWRPVSTRNPPVSATHRAFYTVLDSNPAPRVNAAGSSPHSRRLLIHTVETQVRLLFHDTVTPCVLF